MLEVNLFKLMTGLIIDMARGIRVVEPLDESESMADNSDLHGNFFSDDKLTS